MNSMSFLYLKIFLTTVFRKWIDGSVDRDIENRRYVPGNWNGKCRINVNWTNKKMQMEVAF